jgi:hypothetical protein
MSEKETIDLSDEIRALQDIKGSLTVMQVAGKAANEYSELFSYQMITNEAFERHIKELKDVVDKLKSFDESGGAYQ